VPLVILNGLNDSKQAGEICPQKGENWRKMRTKSKKKPKNAA
jgi:hypothetical protein